MLGIELDFQPEIITMHTPTQTRAKYIISSKTSQKKGMQSICRDVLSMQDKEFIKYILLLPPKSS